MCKHLTSSSNWNLEVLVFMEGGKPEDRKKPSEQGENQQQTKATCQLLEPNRGHGGGRRVLSPLRQPCSHFSRMYEQLMINYLATRMVNER